jgi:hypothetical protein
MKRAGEELGFSSKERVLALRNLAAGEFFAFGPAISPVVTKVKIGEVQTSHPKAGSWIMATPIPPTAKIRAILDSLKDLPQEAEEEAKTVGALQQQITILKRQLTQKHQGTQNSVASKEIDVAIKTALQRQQRLFDQEKQGLENRTTRLQQVLRDIVVTIANVLEEPVPNAIHEMRQAFIFQGKYLTYNQLDKLMQPHEAYKALPAKVSQHILMVLVNNWTAFKEARDAYEEDPSRFTGRPGLPKYKHKQEGRNLLIYTLQAISRGKHGLQRGIINPHQHLRSGCPPLVLTRRTPVPRGKNGIVPLEKPSTAFPY